MSTDHTLSKDEYSNNSSQPSEGKHSTLLYAGFNQDYSCIAVGTSTGFRIFNCSPFRLRYQSRNLGPCRLVTMLFSSSLIAIAGGGVPVTLPASSSNSISLSSSPRRIALFNTKTDTLLCEISFRSAVLSILMSKDRLVAVLERKIHILELKTMKVIHCIDSPMNPRGLCLLSSSNTNQYMIFPRSFSEGKLLIYDAHTLQVVSTIEAHHQPIITMALNRDGTLVATASTKGTMIRIFSVPTGTKLYSFRRGSYPTSILSLSFNLSSKLLCCSSISSTIHIFSISEQKSHQKSASRLTSYLPDVLHDIVDPSRSFAWIDLGTSNNLASDIVTSTISAVGPLLNTVVKSKPVDNSKKQTHLNTTDPLDGLCCRYSVPIGQTGACKLQAEDPLFDPSHDVISASLFPIGSVGDSYDEEEDLKKDDILNQNSSPNSNSIDIKKDLVNNNDNNNNNNETVST